MLMAEVRRTYNELELSHITGHLCQGDHIRQHQGSPPYPPGAKRKSLETSKERCLPHIDPALETLVTYAPAPKNNSDMCVLKI